MKTVKKQLIEQKRLMNVLRSIPYGMSVQDIKDSGLDLHNSINILLAKKKIIKYNKDGNLPITKDTIMRVKEDGKVGISHRGCIAL
jgi:hypothetical protein